MHGHDLQTPRIEAYMFVTEVAWRSHQRPPLLLLHPDQNYCMPEDAVHTNVLRLKARTHSVMSIPTQANKVHTPE